MFSNDNAKPLVGNQQVNNGAYQQSHTGYADTMNYPEMPLFHESPNYPFNRPKTNDTFDKPLSSVEDIEKGYNYKELEVSPPDVKLALKNAFRSHVWFFLIFQVLIFVVVNFSLFIANIDS